MQQPELQGSERTVASTAFGTVTNRRVMYAAQKGWFSGGLQEDLPLKHVTSIRVEINRRIVPGVLLVLVGLGLLSADGVLKLVGAVALAFGAILLWGSPRVVLNTAGGDFRPSTGLPWLRAEAHAFVQAVRGELFKD